MRNACSTTCLHPSFRDDVENEERSRWAPPRPPSTDGLHGSNDTIARACHGCRSRRAALARRFESWQKRHDLISSRIPCCPARMYLPEGGRQARLGAIYKDKKRGRAPRAAEGRARRRPTATCPGRTRLDRDRARRPVASERDARSPVRHRTRRGEILRDVLAEEETDTWR